MTNGSSRRGYRPRQAQILSDERSQSRRNTAYINQQILHQVRYLLSLLCSTEQNTSQLPISPEMIYQKIYADKGMGGHLWRSLRCRKQKCNRYTGGRDRRDRISDIRSITLRPESIERCAHIGQWEGSTVIGSTHQRAIVTLVERKSGYAVVTKLNRKTPDLVNAAIDKQRKPITSRFKTISYDNGKEFTGQRTIDRFLVSTAYFTDPFDSCKRRSNENYNSLLKQCIPEKGHLSSLTDSELKVIEDRLNHGPRKRLGFKTTYQMLLESFIRGALLT